ncbi:uncharacterized protein JCM10292_005674 [Rhodotorula paludigena]|uniref:uncharacterized protein n=1 Tax=Rhodotorula paludigena TaxID=86838 RepID=UPI003179B99E
MFDRLPAELQALVLEFAVPPPSGSTWAENRIQTARTLALVHPTWTRSARRLMWEPMWLNVSGYGAISTRKLERRITKAEEVLGRPVRSLWLELPMRPMPKEARALDLLVGKCPQVEEAWINYGGGSFATLSKLSKLTRLHLIGIEFERGASFAGIADRLAFLSFDACFGALHLAPLPHLSTLVFRSCKAPERRQDVNFARQFPSVQSFEWGSVSALPTSCVNTLPASVRRLALGVIYEPYKYNHHDTGTPLVLPDSLEELILRVQMRKDNEDDEDKEELVRQWGQQACDKNGVRLQMHVEEIQAEAAHYVPQLNELYSGLGGLWY